MINWLKSLFSFLWTNEEELNSKEVEELEERRRIYENRMHDPFFDSYESDDDQS